MYAWEAIQTSLDYIEEHYDKELNISDLAQLVHLSPYYYQRLFNRLVHKSVGEYIKLRRLAKAAEKLKMSDQCITEIALDCGFSDHSHLTKTFKSIYEITPQEYRKDTLTLDVFLKPNLLLNYTLIEENVPLIVEDMVLTIEKRILTVPIILQGESKEASIAKLNEPKINILTKLWDQIIPSRTESPLMDVLTLSDNPEYFNYFVGFENNPKGNEIRELSIGEYIVCSYEAEDFNRLVNEYLYKASGYLYGTWLVEKKIETEPIIIQKYFRPENEPCYIELWAKIKNRKE